MRPMTGSMYEPDILINERRISRRCFPKEASPSFLRSERRFWGAGGSGSQALRDAGGTIRYEYIHLLIINNGNSGSWCKMTILRGRGSRSVCFVLTKYPGGVILLMQEVIKMLPRFDKVLQRLAPYRKRAAASRVVKDIDRQERFIQFFKVIRARPLVGRWAGLLLCRVLADGLG